MIRLPLWGRTRSKLVLDQRFCSQVVPNFFRQAYQLQCDGTLFTVQKPLPLLNDGGSMILGRLTRGVDAEGRSTLNLNARNRASALSFERIRRVLFLQNGLAKVTLGGMTREVQGGSTRVHPLGHLDFCRKYRERGDQFGVWFLCAGFRELHAGGIRSQRRKGGCTDEGPGRSDPSLAS